MNDLEQRIKEELLVEADLFERRTPAASGLPWLTPGIRGRLHRRQFLTVVVTTALVAALAVGSFAAVSIATRTTRPPAVPAGVGPLPTGTQDTPSGWPTVVFGRGQRPRLDYESGQRATLIG